jgi:hypothetical protein
MTMGIRERQYIPCGIVMNSQSKMTYDVGKQGSGLGETQKSGRVQLVNGSALTNLVQVKYTFVS